MDQKLLEKFYRKECTAAETKAVLRWFSQEELQQAQADDLVAIWKQAEFDKHELIYAHDEEKLFASILARKEQKDDEATPVRSLLPVTSWKRHLMIAVALLLPFCIVWVLAQNYTNERKPQLITIEAQPGVRKTITLEDGSVVRLHSGSSISFYNDFKANRTISLSGEAFFEVANDSLHPFTVRSGPIQTRALGTSFNINNQENSAAITVALANGRVKISQYNQGGEKQIAMLEPGQQLVYNKPKAGYQVELFNQSRVLGWKDGVLHFESASLAKVIQELERWYGVKVTVIGDTTNPGWHYTGSYDRQSLDAVLQGISFVKKFTYTRPDSNTVLLSLGHEL